MSRRFNVRLGVACGFLAAVLGASPGHAAPASGEAERDPTQIRFVDLTAGGGVQPSAAAAASNSSGTGFVDLTSGAAPVPMQDPAAESDGTPPTMFVDLTTGAPPVVEETDRYEEADHDRITITADRANDPYEEANRGRFRTHVALHRYAIDPVERTYFAVVPEPARMGVHNFLTNLETPSVLANDVLQGEADRAGDTLSRFVVNSTLGIFGIFDVAGEAGIPYRDDDFGATLATYGVGDYPYLLVPVIGPSNPRDLTGKLVDFFLNPIRYLALPGGFVTSLSHAGLHELDKRSEDSGELDMLARTAPDAYAAERSEALARRRAELDGTPPGP